MFVSMLSCSALERSNNPYIESIVGPCFSKNQKDIFNVWVWFWRKLKKYPWGESGICVIVCWREKNNSFEISVIILRYIRYVNHSYSIRILKLQSFLEKTSIFLFFRGRPKNGNKQRRRRKYIRKSN